MIIGGCKKIVFGHFWCKMGFGVWLTSVYGRVGLSDLVASKVIRSRAEGKALVTYNFPGSGVGLIS